MHLSFVAFECSFEIVAGSQIHFPPARGGRVLENEPGLDFGNVCGSNCIELTISRVTDSHHPGARKVRLAVLLEKGRSAVVFPRDILAALLVNSAILAHGPLRFAFAHEAATLAQRAGRASAAAGAAASTAASLLH